MWEAKLNGRAASLQRVRTTLTEREEWAAAGGEWRLVRGLRHTAELMCAADDKFPDRDGWQIASLAARFIQEFNNETSGVRSTADTQTAWMLSEPMIGDLGRDGVDFRALKQRPCTVYVTLPAKRLRTHGVWLRLVIVAALRALYSPGGIPVLFMLDEFAQLADLGAIEDALGQARGYGVALWPVLQDFNQLRDLYGPRAETFAGMSGAIFGFAPNDQITAEWMPKRSGEETILGLSAGEAEGGRPLFPGLLGNPPVRAPAVGTGVACSGSLRAAGRSGVSRSGVEPASAKAGVARAAAVKPASIAGALFSGRGAGFGSLATIGRVAMTAGALFRGPGTRLSSCPAPARSSAMRVVVQCGRTRPQDQSPAARSRL
ncbi:MAG: type IV secretory system conjugative DNA transfer family protein [Methylocella sp.]